KTIAIVTSKFPSAQFQSSGAREVAKQRGLKELLYLEYEFGTRDFGPIAARIKDANPDLLWVGALGLDGNLVLEELKRLDYAPRGAPSFSPPPGAGLGGRGRARHAPPLGDVLRGAPAVLEQPGRREVRRGLPRARGQGRRALHERRHAGGRLVRGVADARGG